MQVKPVFLLDTGPLSVLCGFPRDGMAYIHTVLLYSEIMLPDNVVSEIQEAQTGKIARVVSPLLKTGAITSATPVNDPLILDQAYNNLLGLGERGAIKAALATGISMVLDDKDAFIVACRFGLRPIGFQDFIIQLKSNHGMPKSTAVEIVNTTSRQYPAAFLTHTLSLLS